MDSVGISSTPEERYDPVFLHSRREAILIVGAWAAGLVWAVPYCYLNGYGLPPGEVSTTFGVPTWLFWGILIPWIAADLFTAWFCFFYFVEDDLEEDRAGVEAATAGIRSEAAS